MQGEPSHEDQNCIKKIIILTTFFLRLFIYLTVPCGTGSLVLPTGNLKPCPVMWTWGVLATGTTGDSLSQVLMLNFCFSRVLHVCLFH